MEDQEYVTRYANLLQKLDVVERHRKLATYDLPQRIIDGVERELERRSHVDVVSRAFAPKPLPTDLTGGKLLDGALGFWGHDGAPKVSKQDTLLDRALGRGEGK
jgi:hypothetical protein